MEKLFGARQCAISLRFVFPDFPKQALVHPKINFPVTLEQLLPTQGLHPEYPYVKDIITDHSRMLSVPLVKLNRGRYFLWHSTVLKLLIGETTKSEYQSWSIEVINLGHVNGETSLSYLLALNSFVLSLSYLHPYSSSNMC